MGIDAIKYIQQNIHICVGKKDEKIVVVECI